MKTTKNPVRNLPAILAKLDERDNLAFKVRKSDDTRRLTSHTPHPTAEQMDECQTPSDIARLAIGYGLSAEEIAGRAKAAPNFGQFRMVIGNRVRHAHDLMVADPKMTPEQAAYPKVYRKQQRDAARTAASMEREKAKATKDEKKPAKKRAVVKISGRKTAAPVTAMKQAA